MARQDQRAMAPGNEGTASVFDSAVNALNATSKNMQAIASEFFEISKQSFEHTTQTLEKLGTARGVDEVTAIQTNLVSVQKHIESAESFVIQGRRPDSRRSRDVDEGKPHSRQSRQAALSE